MQLIELQDIYKTYHLGEVDVPVLKGITLNVAQGELVALMGASGSGKSTLMNILGCLDHPSAGKYWLDGAEVSQLSPDGRALVRNHKIGFVFQGFNLLPRTSAIDNVIMPLTYTAEYLSDSEALARGIEVLTKVGLKDRLDHEPSQLSGGQQQRVGIARALSLDPKVILFDEPTSSLDPEKVGEVLDVIKKVAHQGITMLIVTHEISFARNVANRVVFMDGGEIVEDSAPKEFFLEPKCERAKQFLKRFNDDFVYTI